MRRSNELVPDVQGRSCLIFLASTYPLIKFFPIFFRAAAIFYANKHFFLFLDIEGKKFVSPGCGFLHRKNKAVSCGESQDFPEFSIRSYKCRISAAITPGQLYFFLVSILSFQLRYISLLHLSIWLQFYVCLE